MWPFLLLSLALSLARSTTAKFSFELHAAPGAAPTGVGRCCFADETSCLNDSHCLEDCVDGGDAYDCKNCMCWSAGQGCCSEDYACTSVGGSTDPHSGTCKPYCFIDAAGQACYGHGTCSAPNTCQCETGWNTTLNCETCNDLNYGPNCDACPVDPSGTVCSGHGSCDGGGTNAGNGGCDCVSGWNSTQMCNTCDDANYGPNCASCPVDSTGTVCAGHGTCDGAGSTGGDGTCSCDNGFDAEKNCDTCDATHFGSKCSKCPVDQQGTVCAGHGHCDGAGTLAGTGSCDCDKGFDPQKKCTTCNDKNYGPTCKSCPVDSMGKVCSGHGECDGAGTTSGDGSCTCKAGWDVAQECATCDQKHYGTDCKSCPVNSMGKVCSGHGKCDGAGTTTGNGVCQCERGWTDGVFGAKCSVCASGYGPPGQCTNFVCKDGCVHGNCSAPNTCSCEKGWSGASCRTTSCADIAPAGVSQCSGHGTCTAPDECTCDHGFQGIYCEIGLAECCATVMCGENPKQCNTCCQYLPGDKGACSDPVYQCKGCDCGVVKGSGTQGCCGGSYCQKQAPNVGAVADLWMIRGKNTHYQNDPTYHCCPASRTGPKCITCATGYFGKECMPCPGGSPNGTNQNTCSGRGVCQQGTCKCEYGWMNEGCQTCDLNVYRCVDDCNGHGTCGCPKPRSTINSTKGVCTCATGYTGAGCDTCITPGYWKNNTVCTKCSGCLSCDQRTGKCPAPSPRPQPEPLTPTPSGDKTSTYILYVLPAAAGLVVVALGCFCCKGNVANKAQRRDSSLLHNVVQSEGNAHGVNQREQTTSSLWRNIMSMNDGPMENSSSNELTSPSFSYEPPSAPDNGDGGVASGAAIYPQPPALPTSTIPVVDPTRDKSQSELYVGGGD